MCNTNVSRCVISEVSSSCFCVCSHLLFSLCLDPSLCFSHCCLLFVLSLCLCVFFLLFFFSLTHLPPLPIVSVSLAFSLSVLFVCLPACLSVSVCLSDCLFACLTVCLSVSVCLTVCLPACLSLSVCLSDCLSLSFSQSFTYLVCSLHDPAK